MKIFARQYARSLYDSISEKSEGEIKVALKNFVAILGRNRELNKANEIINIFTEIWSKERGELNAELTSARELKPATRQIAVDYLKERTASKKIILTESIDKKIIGGFILKYDNKVLDGSLKTSLEDFKNTISN